MMQDDIQSTFTAYIEEFKKQNIEIKRNEIINSLKELISVLDIICKEEEIAVEFLKSNEVNDIKGQNISEDDFLEACLVYVENVKNIISKYLIFKNFV